MTTSRLTWTVHFDEARRVLHVKTAGVLDAQSGLRMRSEVFPLFAKLGCQRLLLDHLGLEGDALSTMDIYDIPRAYVAANIPRSIRLAVVAPPHMFANASFYETVCANNGYYVGAFGDVGTALEWLTT